MKDLARPFGTSYFATTGNVIYRSGGAAASEEGALRAGVTRVFTKQYDKCIVYDRYTGKTMYTIRRGLYGINIVYAEKQTHLKVVA